MIRIRLEAGHGRIAGEGGEQSAMRQHNRTALLHGIARDQTVEEAGGVSEAAGTIFISG
jgi:hypothetical protein